MSSMSSSSWEPFSSRKEAMVLELWPLLTVGADLHVGVVIYLGAVAWTLGEAAILENFYRDAYKEASHLIQFRFPGTTEFLGRIHGERPKF